MSKPYPITTRGRIITTVSRSSGIKSRPLWLYWEVLGDPVSDYYDPRDISAADLWKIWRAEYYGDTLPIYWSVCSLPSGIFESAPGYGIGDEDFLTFYEWPTDSFKRRARWADIPVIDKYWTPNNADKGGFIQEHAGWKPSPLQSVMDVALIERLMP